MPVPNVVVRDVACGANHTVRLTEKTIRRAPKLPTKSKNNYQTSLARVFHMLTNPCCVCSWCWTHRSGCSAGASGVTGDWATPNRRTRWFLD